MIVEYDYEPQGQQELELKTGDKIEVEFFRLRDSMCCAVFQNLTRKSLRVSRILIFILHSSSFSFFVARETTGAFCNKFYSL